MKTKVTIFSITSIMFIILATTYCAAYMQEADFIPTIEQIDYSAPAITFDLSELIDHYIFKVKITEDSLSDIDSYTIYHEYNTTSVDITSDPSVNITTDTAKLVEFSVDLMSLFYNDTHNNITVFAENDEYITTPFPGLQQGGAGGGAGGGFCQNPTCWHPVQNQPQNSYRTQDATLLNTTDITAPFVFFDLTNYRCCGIVEYSDPVEDGAGPANTTYTIGNEGDIVVETINQDGVSIVVSLIQACKICEDCPFPIWSMFFGIFALVATSITIKKRKK
jgi:hypothetical protein